MCVLGGGLTRPVCACGARAAGSLRSLDPSIRFAFGVCVLWVLRIVLADVGALRARRSTVSVSDMTHRVLILLPSDDAIVSLRR